MASNIKSNEVKEIYDLNTHELQNHNSAHTRWMAELLQTSHMNTFNPHVRDLRPKTSVERIDEIIAQQDPFRF